MQFIPDSSGAFVQTFDHSSSRYLLLFLSAATADLLHLLQYLLLLQVPDTDVTAATIDVFSPYGRMRVAVS